MVKVSNIYFTGITVIFFSAYNCVNTVANVVNFSGNKYNPIEIIPDSKTGIDAVFVLKETDGISFEYKTSSSAVRFYSFDSRGISFKTPLKYIASNDNKYTIDILDNDSGYIIEDGDKNYCFWIIDYNRNKLSIQSVYPIDSTDCDITKIGISGSGSPIIYYSTQGQREILSREIDISFFSLEFDNTSSSFKQVKKHKSIPYFADNIIISPPIYCNTTFTIMGDNFLKEWGHGIYMESEPFLATGIGIEASMIVHDDTGTDNSNIVLADSGSASGSAPFSVTFKGIATDAVTHSEWQFASDIDFKNITHRFHESEINYSFTNDGTTYVRFIGSNNGNSCEAISNIFTINIGSSELKIPNAFSPNGDGINDVWKVSYRSILDFECRIYDKNGHEIYHFTDPSLGWDGKRNGKYAAQGVYFYTLTATGADGKRYKKSGDINLISRSIRQ